jgi:hypothetical protein
LQFACTPACCSPFRSPEPDLTHPNGSRLEAENILREDKEDLNKVITLQLQF